MKQSPCLNCITAAICRHRDLPDLLQTCQLVKDHTEFIYDNTFNGAECYESDNYNFDRLVQVYQALKPTKWSLNSTYSGR
jgi:hypothetical protein